jgi:hypothetical protein
MNMTMREFLGSNPTGHSIVCEKCKLPMTPENSKLRPELFYCDVCLPDEHKPHELAKEDADALNGRGVIVGLTLDVPGREIIAHCHQRATYYAGLVMEAQEREAKLEQERQKLLNNLKDPNKECYGFPPANFFTSYIGPTPKDQLLFFTFVAQHISKEEMYRLSMKELRDLEWISGPFPRG